jgi:hypothetical protein
LYFLLIGFCCYSMVCEAKAQGAFNALTPSLPYAPPGGSPLQGPYVELYVNGGVGWTFTPTANILVTGISSLFAPQVSIWLGTNQILTSFSYTPDANNLGSFEPIAPFLLSAGQNYAMSAQNPNFESAIQFLIGSTAGTGLPLVSFSSYLTGFGDFNLSTNGVWTPFPSSNNTDIVSIGPNFQFQVVPEPSTIAFSLLGLLFCFRKLKSVA